MTSRKQRKYRTAGSPTSKNAQKKHQQTAILLVCIGMLSGATFLLVTLILKSKEPEPVKKKAVVMNVRIRQEPEQIDMPPFTAKQKEAPELPKPKQKVNIVRTSAVAKPKSKTKKTAPVWVLASDKKTDIEKNNLTSDFASAGNSLFNVSSGSGSAAVGWKQIKWAVTVAANYTTGQRLRQLEKIRQELELLAKNASDSEVREQANAVLKKMRHFDKAQ